MFFIGVFFFCLLGGVLGGQGNWVFLDNGKVRLGVNLDAGGSIGWFSRSDSKDNLLNAFDHGRYVQQSFYGDADGSDWNGQPWRYNPVQGGSWKGVPATVLEKKETPTSLYVKTKPRQWASGKDVDDMILEEWLTLDGALARMKFRMTYTGTTEHKARHQELPAMFVPPRFDTLVFCDKATGTIVRQQPGKPNEYIKFSEPWLAWVDAAGQGIGIYAPHTDFATVYRVRDSGKGDVSYAAPLQTFGLKAGLVFEYDSALITGTVEEIRAVCTKLKAAR